MGKGKGRLKREKIRGKGGKRKKKKGRREQRKEQKIAFVQNLIFTSQTLPNRFVIYSNSSSNIHQLPWTY